MVQEMNKKLRVLIVDDSSFMRMAIRSIISRDPDIEVVGTANNGAEGVAKALALKPDLSTLFAIPPMVDSIAKVTESTYVQITIW